MKKEKRIQKDAKVLNKFIRVYCKAHHNPVGELCDECNELLQYALKRNEKCPLDPKPQCKKCHVHCYKSEMRQRIKEVMKFSGIYLIKHGQLHWAWHYFM